MLRHRRPVRSRPRRCRPSAVAGSDDPPAPAGSRRAPGAAVPRRTRSSPASPTTTDVGGRPARPPRGPSAVAGAAQPRPARAASCSRGGWAMLLAVLAVLIVAGTIALASAEGVVGRLWLQLDAGHRHDAGGDAGPAGHRRAGDHRRPGAARHRYALLWPGDGGGVLRLRPAQRPARGAPQPAHDRLLHRPLHHLRLRTRRPPGRPRPAAWPERRTSSSTPTRRIASGPEALGVRYLESERRRRRRPAGGRDRARPGGHRLRRLRRRQHLHRARPRAGCGRTS